MHHAATRHIVRGTSLMTTRITHHLRLFATTKGQPTQLHDAVSTTPMTWPDFFATRRRLQLLKRFAGIPFVVGFWAAEGFILSLPIFDPTKTILDVDPMVLVGLATIGGTLASYFVGASCTGWLWRVFKRDTAMLLDLVSKLLCFRHPKLCWTRNKEIFTLASRSTARTYPRIRRR